MTFLILVGDSRMSDQVNPEMAGWPGFWNIENKRDC